MSKRGTKHARSELFQSPHGAFSIVKDTNGDVILRIRKGPDWIRFLFNSEDEPKKDIKMSLSSGFKVSNRLDMAFPEGVTLEAEKATWLGGELEEAWTSAEQGRCGALQKIFKAREPGTKQVNATTQ